MGKKSRTSLTIDKEILRKAREVGLNISQFCENALTARTRLIEKGFKKCYSCGIEMQFAQRIPFRVKGRPGLVKLVFGEWAAIGEELMSFDVYICPSCGEIRFSTDEPTRRSLLGKAFLKRCVKCDKEIPLASEECAYCGTKQP